MTAKCWQNVLPVAGFELGTSSIVRSAPLTTTLRRPQCFFGAHGRRGTKTEILKRQKDAESRELPEEIKITLSPQNGVRYTVPSEIRIGHMAEEQLVRFRVGNVYKNCYIRA